MHLIKYDNKNRYNIKCNTSGINTGKTYIISSKTGKHCFALIKNLYNNVDINFELNFDCFVENSQHFLHFSYNKAFMLCISVSQTFVPNLSQKGCASY